MENYTIKERKTPQRMTIREIAATGILPEHALRVLVKQKKVPCLTVGKKALINYNKLVEMLENL